MSSWSHLSLHLSLPKFSLFIRTQLYGMRIYSNDRYLNLSSAKIPFPGKVHSLVLGARTVTSFLLLLFSHSVMYDSATPWTAACQASPSFTISQSLFKLMSIESVMPSNHLILYRPLLLPSSIFHSMRVFSNESALRIRWPKYWRFSFSISSSNKYSGLISFRMD